WLCLFVVICVVFFFQAEDGIRDWSVTGVQTCALPICFGHQASSRLGNDPDRDVAEGFIEGSRQRSAVNVEREHGIEIRGGEPARSEEHTSELQSLTNLVCRLLLEKKKRCSTSRTTRDT